MSKRSKLGEMPPSLLQLRHSESTRPAVLADLDNAAEGLIQLADQESLALARQIVEHIPKVYTRVGGVLTESGRERYRRMLNDISQAQK